MKRLAAVLFALCATAATAADAPVTPDGFDALSRGRTLVYSDGDRPYGIERYLPGRRVIWAFVGEECREGHWYAEDGDVCFVYEDNPVPQCWTYFNTPEGLKARFRGDPAGAPMITIRDSAGPMPCEGPMLGV